MASQRIGAHNLQTMNYKQPDLLALPSFSPIKEERPRASATQSPQVSFLWKRQITSLQQQLDAKLQSWVHSSVFQPKPARVARLLTGSARQFES